MWLGLSLLSLLMIIGSAMAWIDSIGVVRQWRFGSGVKTHWITYSNGTANLAMQVEVSPSRLRVTRNAWAGFLWQTAVDEGWTATGGAGASNGHGLILWRVGVPLWLPLLLGVASALWLVCRWQLWQRDRWALQGRCVMCGYDLRASADECPECGNKVDGCR